MSNTTNRYFLGVVKLNLPFRVEQVELAPLVFVPAIIITLSILAAAAAFIHGPAEPVYQESVKQEVAGREMAVARASEVKEEREEEKPSGIRLNYLVSDLSAKGGEIDTIRAEGEDADPATGENGDTDLSGADSGGTEETSAGSTEIDLMSADVSRMIPRLTEYYNRNHDCVGWLKVDNTIIDYPVMQKKDDNGYYVYRDFNKKQDQTGCIVMDSDAEYGTGTRVNGYQDGSRPSTNIIIGGHNMRNGSMFGNLDLFRDRSYEQSHSIIRFSTLYEEREYKIVSVFLSQIYPSGQQNVFRYYTFYDAYSREEFDNFISNIKKLQLYDTGVSAEYGDELITLNTCTYHVKNGRLVVVGKRIR